MRIEDHAEVTRLIENHREVTSLRKDVADHGVHCTLNVPAKSAIRLSYDLEAAAKHTVLTTFDLWLEQIAERLASLGVEV